MKGLLPKQLKVQFALIIQFENVWISRQLGVWKKKYNFWLSRNPSDSLFCSSITHLFNQLVCACVCVQTVANLQQRGICFPDVVTAAQEVGFFLPFVFRFVSPRKFVGLAEEIKKVNRSANSVNLSKPQRDVEQLTWEKMKLTDCTVAKWSN